MSNFSAPNFVDENCDSPYEEYLRLVEKYRGCISQVFFHENRLTICPVNPNKGKTIFINYRVIIERKPIISVENSRSLVIHKSELLSITDYFIISGGILMLNGEERDLEPVRQDLEIVLGGFELINALIDLPYRSLLELSEPIIPDVVRFDEPTPSQTSIIRQHKETLEQLLNFNFESADFFDTKQK